MDFELGPAVGAGVIVTAAITAVSYVLRLGRATGMDMLLIQGSVVSGRRVPATIIGGVTHVVVLGGLVFGSLYALAFSALLNETGQAWWFGLVLGAFHGWLSGMILFPALAAVHPRMAKGDEAFPDTWVHEASPEQVATDEKPVAGSAGYGRQILTEDPELRLRPPGPFGSQYGAATPVQLMVFHALYGLGVGLLYGAFVG